jgi:hypothetical protein
VATDKVDAVRRGKTNRWRGKRLRERQEELELRAAEDNAALQKARQTLYDEALVPFHDVFQRLKRVDPVEPAAIERPTVDGERGIGLRRPRKSAVPAVVGTLACGALLGVVGQLVVGRAVEAGAYRAVKAFGSASTGKPISSLYGAAAHRATVARFGGGSIAAGGGGMAAGKRVMSEIHSTSADVWRVAVVKWQIQSLTDGRQERARDLERRETAASLLHERSKDMRRVLHDLRVTLERRLPSFTALVDTCDDFARYDSRQRAEVAALVDLYDLAAMVMDCPITDTNGRITEESGRVVADAEARLRAMETEETES